MARKGENIRKRNDGRWEGRYQIYENGVAKTKSVYAPTYREVKQKRIAAQHQSNLSKKEADESSTCLQQITLNSLATEWMDASIALYKQSTYVKYKNIYEKHIRIPFGNRHIINLTNEALEHQLNTNLSASTIRSIYAVLNNIYAYGTKKYHIEEKIFKRIGNRAGTRNKSTALDTLDTSEQARLLQYLSKDTDIYKLGIFICLSTGLRLGEVCALKWCDIDMDMKLLHVNHTIQRLPVENQNSKTLLIETSPKSYHSKREIPLSEQLYVLLRDFKSADGYVLNGSNPMDPRTLQYRFERILKELNIRKTNFHTLRHTFATNCIQTGADIKSVSEVLGHADVKITLNRYVHPSMDTKREYLNTLSSIYGQISGQQIS